MRAVARESDAQRDCVHKMPAAAMTIKTGHADMIHDTQLDYYGRVCTRGEARGKRT